MICSDFKLKVFCIHIFIGPNFSPLNHGSLFAAAEHAGTFFVLFFVFVLFCSSSVSSVFFSHPLPQLTFNSHLILIYFFNSSCQERTARTAPSKVFPATGAPTLTLPCTHPWHPLSVRAALHRPPRNPYRASHPRTPQPTGPSRENRTPLRSGPSPGACMKVGVSILFFGGGWMRAAWGAGQVETFGVLKCTAYALAGFGGTCKYQQITDLTVWSFVFFICLRCWHTCHMPVN